tara:strand:+ start:166 stop:396 length:231 start_codon:yes stop_codon:yes gene_type:complete
MKNKTITLNISGTSQNQWSTFILELNLMKKAWKRYGVEVELKTPSVGKIISQGTSRGEKLVHYKKKKLNHIINIFG